MGQKFELDFNEKYVLITGANRGIGYAIAKKFVELGAHVILHGRNKERIEPVAKELGADYVFAELDSHDEVEKMLATLCETYDTIHVLINNAGFEIIRPFEEYTMDEFDKIFNVNIRSVFQLTQGIFPLLTKAKNAAVINISSIHQTLPYPTNLVYAMSKAAMEMFTKIVGIEWAPYNIRVNTLAPGAILTDMNREIIENIGMGTFASWIGSGKIGSVEDMCNACIYLASDMSRYMTAETLYVDGGLSKGLLPYGRTPAMRDMVDNLIAQDDKQSKEKG